MAGLYAGRPATRSLRLSPRRGPAGGYGCPTRVPSRQEASRHDPIRQRDQDLPWRDDGRRRADPRGTDRAHHRLRRALGLRQDDEPADDQSDDRADERHHHHRRGGHRVDEPRRAAARDRLRHPARRPVPPPHDPGQRHDRAPAARQRQGRHPEPRDGAARGRRAGPRPGPALPGAAVRRPAAARRCGPGAGGRPAGHADGRAVQRRRPRGARAAAGRVPAPAGRARQDHRLRHPRHRRGRQARRPDRGAPGRGHPGPAGHPRAAAARPARRLRGRLRGARPRLPRPGLPEGPAPPPARRAHRPRRRLRRAAPRGRGRRALGAGPRRGRPAAGLGPGRGRADTLDRTLLHRGGTVGREGGTLRAALDAALSSPTGKGVIADADGRFVGTVRAQDVLAQIERQQPPVEEGVG